MHFCVLLTQRRCEPTLTLLKCYVINLINWALYVWTGADVVTSRCSGDVCATDESSCKHDDDSLAYSRPRHVWRQS